MSACDVSFKINIDLLSCLNSIREDSTNSLLLNFHVTIGLGLPNAAQVILTVPDDPSVLSDVINGAPKNQKR